jgi:N-acetylneuraminic acid mutarotase
VLLAPVAAVTQGDAIYVFAKLAWDAGSSTWVPNPSVYRYAPASGGWCALDFATPDPVWYNQRPVNLDGVVYLTADDNTTNSTYQVALPVVEATPVAASSIARSGAGTGTVAGKVYLWSGYSGNPRTLQTEVYDPANGLWSSVANFPSGRDYMSTFALDGRLYSVAGEGPGSGSFSKSVYRYDPQTSRWTTLNNFPVTSWMAMAAVCGGRAYLIGGRPGYGKTVADVYEYNEAADSWTARAPMPVPVMLAGAASHGGKVYVFGGNFKTDEAHNLHTNTVQVFDPVADTWTRLPDMPAVLLAPVAAVTQGEAIYVFAKLAWDAGSSTWVPNPSVYRYAPASGGWCALDYSTPEPVWYNQRPANLGGVIYLTADDNTTNTVYRVDLPEPPELAVQPVHQTTSPGGSVTFNVSASGYPPRSYQWFFNGNPIAGANGARLSLTSVQTAQVGSYTCTVSTPFGSITSMPATLGLIGLDFIARVTLTGPIGTKYEVQYRLALPEGEWLRLTNVTLTAISQEFIDWGSPGHPYRFYRAIPLP